MKSLCCSDTAKFLVFSAALPRGVPAGRSAGWTSAASLSAFRVRATSRRLVTAGVAVSAFTTATLSPDQSASECARLSFWSVASASLPFRLAKAAVQSPFADWMAWSTSLWSAVLGRIAFNVLSLVLNVSFGMCVTFLFVRLRPCSRSSKHWRESAVRGQCYDRGVPAVHTLLFTCSIPTCFAGTLFVEQTWRTYTPCGVT